MRAVQDGWRAVSESRRTQSRTASSSTTSGPGDNSPALNSSNAGWAMTLLATDTASSHSRRSSEVDR